MVLMLSLFHTCSNWGPEWLKIIAGKYIDRIKPRPSAVESMLPTPLIPNGRGPASLQHGALLELSAQQEPMNESLLDEHPGT